MIIALICFDVRLHPLFEEGTHVPFVYVARGAALDGLAARA